MVLRFVVLDDADTLLEKYAAIVRWVSEIIERLPRLLRKVVFFSGAVEGASRFQTS